VLDAQKILRIIHSFHRDRKIKVSGHGSSLKIYQTTCVGTRTIKIVQCTRNNCIYLWLFRQNKSKISF